MVRANETTHSHDFTAVDGYTETDNDGYLLSFEDCALGHTDCRKSNSKLSYWPEALNSEQTTKSTTNDGLARPNQSSHNHEHTPKRIVIVSSGTWKGYEALSCPSGHSKCLPEGYEVDSVTLPTGWQSSLHTFNTSTETRPRGNEKGHQHNVRWEDFDSSSRSLEKPTQTRDCPAGHTFCQFDYAPRFFFESVNEITGVSEVGFG